MPGKRARSESESSCPASALHPSSAIGFALEAAGGAATLPGMKAAALLAAVLLVCRLAGAQENPAADPDQLPTPPEQTHPWTAPRTSLPAAVVSASAALFDLGMADPRGCEYREVELVLAWGPVKEHGWLLPAAEGTPRYAVGWNGLVYPVKSVGAPADLAKDMGSMIDGRFRGNGNGWPMSDHGSLNAAEALAIKVALLLRLGQTALAETVWRNGCAGDPKLARTDPYVEMATLWLGRWDNQAVEAYLRDDYPAALAICRRVLPVEAKARALAHTRNSRDPLAAWNGENSFWQLPALTAEAQRRIHEPPAGVSVLDSGQPAAGPARIAALIDELDRVHVAQRMNPGATDVLDFPVVQALVKAGDEAVPALLACVVADQRLTRSQFTEGMGADGPIIPVYEAAYVALFRFLNRTVPPFEHDGAGERDEQEPRDLNPQERQALAAKLEAAWKTRHKDGPSELAYATLRNDHASAKAWLQAVDEIVQPADGQSTDYRLEFPAVGGYSIRIDDKPFTPRGEALRSRTDPPVRELIIRCFERIMAHDNFGPERENAPGKLLLSLAGWDGSAHLDDLRRLQGELVATLHRLSAVTPDDSGVWYDLDAQTHMIVRVFAKRLELGDAGALAEYADFLPTLRRGASIEDFQLLWRHPDDPAVSRAADKLFGAGSPWVPLVGRYSQRYADLIRTPLVALPAFQRELDRGLGDRSSAGQVTVDKDRFDDENGTVSGGTSPNPHARDPLSPPDGSKIHYRVCDSYACELSLLDGCPECELYWPQANRDRAVEACRAFLHRCANNFRYRDPEDRGRDNPDRAAAGPPIHFPVLDHPATPEDVAAGRAVFSLPAPSRVCRVPDLPLPVSRPGKPAGAHEAEAGANLAGEVWQAEETLVDGRWERFYGFVGRYQMARVPAAELVFGAAGSSENARVTPQISGSIETPPRFVGEELSLGDGYRSDFIPRGAPVPVQAKVLNHSGLDQMVPGAVVLPADAGRALPAGISLTLGYSGKIPPPREDYSDHPFDYGAWKGMPWRDGVRPVVGEGAGPVLSPGQESTVLNIDLRDYFDVSRAGSYRLQGTFHVPGQPESPTREIIFSVAR